MSASEPKATTRALHTMGVKASCGFWLAMPSKPAAINSCDSSNQLRRRPRRRVSPGSGKRSTSGAHTHLKA